MKKIILLLAIVCIVDTVSTHASYRRRNRAAEGAFLGGISGAALGGAMGGGKGAAIGGVFGAGVGASIGASADRDYYEQEYYQPVYTQPRYQRRPMARGVSYDDYNEPMEQEFIPED